MYRVVVKDKGKYNNVLPGMRYCFTKRSVIDLAVSFELYECEYEVEKFIRLYNDIFCWSNSGVSEKIWDKIYKNLEKEKEEEKEEDV